MFFIQIILGAVTFLLWFIMWFVDSEDEANEEEEMRKWKEAEKRMKNSIYGKGKKISLITGMHPFFNDSVAAVMLSLAVSLPITNCNIHITIWFLYAGVISIPTNVFDKLLKDVNDRLCS